MAAGSHCVLLDVGRLGRFDGFAHPVMAFLAWVLRETGVRGAPHLAEGPARLVRFAIPVGLGVDAATDAAGRIAAALKGGTAPVDLVAADESPSPVLGEYHPAEDVPEDVTAALRAGERPEDDNHRVLLERCPDVERHLVRVGEGQVEAFVVPGRRSSRGTAAADGVQRRSRLFGAFDGPADRSGW